MESFEIKQGILKLKSNSGSHSPSIETILDLYQDIKINVDACFISNPYATELFMDHFQNDLIKTNKLRDYLEYYPPQNREVAKHISKISGVNYENIFVGNGAIEIIQAILHKFVKGKLCVIIPTFSSYYEFVNKDTEVKYFELKKSEDYKLNIDELIKFILDNKINNLVLINPNNPNGSYISKTELSQLLNKLSHLDNILLDESFIHFAFEDDDLKQVSLDNSFKKFENIFIIKSMSKDFGIAGIRAGYAIMAKNKVAELLQNGYLWNVSGLANYFFRLYSSENFKTQYEIVRKKYIMNTQMFFSEISKLKKIKVYPSMANFALVELPQNQSSFDFTMNLLLDHNVYVRDCGDKIGLEGNFIRVSSRSFEENLQTIEAIKNNL